MGLRRGRDGAAHLARLLCGGAALALLGGACTSGSAPGATAPAASPQDGRPGPIGPSSGAGAPERTSRPAGSPTGPGSSTTTATGRCALEPAPLPGAAGPEPPMLDASVPAGTQAVRFGDGVVRRGPLLGSGGRPWLGTTDAAGDGVALPTEGATGGSTGVTAHSCAFVAGASTPDGASTWLAICPPWTGNGGGPAVVARFDVGSPTPAIALDRTNCPSQLVVGGRWLWSVERDVDVPQATVARFDEAGGATATVATDGWSPILSYATDAALWSALRSPAGDLRVVRVDATTATIGARLDLPGPAARAADLVDHFARAEDRDGRIVSPAALGIAGGSLWIVLPHISQIWRVDPDTLAPIEKRDVPGLTYGAGVGGDRVLYHVLRRVLPAANQVADRFTGEGVLVDHDARSGASTEIGPLIPTVSSDRGMRTLALSFPTPRPDAAGWWYDSEASTRCPCRYDVGR